MVDKLTSLTTLITYAKTIRTSAASRSRDSAWCAQWNTKVAERTSQVAARVVYFVSWIDWKQLDDFDFYLLAAALGVAPPRDVWDDSDERDSEILDLTQIKFNPGVLAGLLAAGEK